MDAPAKVHRNRHHRSESRHKRHERQISIHQTTNSPEETIEFPPQSDENITAIAIIESDNVQDRKVTITDAPDGNVTINLSEEHERTPLNDDNEILESTPSHTSQQTVVLINGHVPPQDVHDDLDMKTNSIDVQDNVEHTTINVENLKQDTELMTAFNTASNPVPRLESPTQQQTGGSSRNSSGDALSLRETLQQLPPSVTSHRHRRNTHSPQRQEVDASFHRGILGFMDRELKQCSPTPSALSVGTGTSRKLQSFSDPQASPAQRSIRSRSSLDKSPRRKRSKSESRRRRERKLIAAGEMEVRQANETLMRYLKQCSEMNDASLSGELEIDQTYDERRVHRKTKSQRDKRGYLLSKLYTAGGLSSILKELSDDIVPAEGEEIYNPFTPVVSPTDDTPVHIDKMFLQTSSGYRPVEHCYYKYSFVGGQGGNGVGVGGPPSSSAGSCGRRAGRASNPPGGSMLGGINGNMENVDVATGAGGFRSRSSFVDSHCLLHSCERHEIHTNIQLAYVFQQIWILISNICHGLLAGLALAHVLFVLSSHPTDWSPKISDTTIDANDVAKTFNENTSDANKAVSIKAENITKSVSLSDQQSTSHPQIEHSFIIEDYASFADTYSSTFYFLAILCLVSVFDRMDICRWQLSNATETVSFRWLIIAMIYIATIILAICSNSMDERLYYYNNSNVTLTQEEMFSKSIQSVWSSLSVTRSIGAICGWLMIGLTPHEDLLYEYLLDLSRYQLTNN